MTRSKRVLVVFAVCLLLVSAGCLGGLAGSDGNGNTSGDAGDDGAGDVSETELLSQIEDVETYRFRMNQSTETPQGNVTVTAEGAADEPNERMYTSMTQETDVGLGGAVEIEQYVIGDTQYLLTQGVWQRINVSQQEIWEQDELAQQADVIETGELEAVGTETVSGVETTVVRVDGTDDLIDELEGDVEDDLQSQQGLQGDASIENVTYHFYVDEDTHTLHRTETELTMEQGGQTVWTSMEMTFLEHNEPVDIELPEAAEDAEEVDQGSTAGTA